MLSNAATMAGADYTILIKQATLNQAFWFSHPLWSKKFLRVSSEPTGFADLQQRLLSELNQLGLGFPGADLQVEYENCVYVLVVDSRHEQAPDNWLYQIRDLTKNFAAILEAFDTALDSVLERGVLQRKEIQPYKNKASLVAAATAITVAIGA